MLHPRAIAAPAPVSSILQIASFYPGLGPLSWLATAYTVRGMLPPLEGNGREVLHRAAISRGERLGATVKGVSGIERRGLRPRAR